MLVGTFDDYYTQHQLNPLSKADNDRSARVMRSGQSLDIPIDEIMVGDVLHLEAGDVVPVDGVLIQGHGVRCDESSATDENRRIRKTPGSVVFEALRDGTDERLKKLDPFIISGSKVAKGSGTFLATAVGVNSIYGRTATSVTTKQEPTHLQKKLDVLADWIAKCGAGSAFLLLIILLINFCVTLPDKGGTDQDKARECLMIPILCLSLVAVAVPKGLPLAALQAHRFATVKMLRDNNFIRGLKGLEAMGNATAICIDKTGTLTENKMTLVAATFGKPRTSLQPVELVLDRFKERHEPLQFAVDRLSPPAKQLIIQSNALNSTAFEVVEDGKMTFVGSKTEAALLSFCRDRLGAPPIKEIRASANIIQAMPFNSEDKYSAVCVKLDENRYRVYIKGAAEILLKKCSTMLRDTSKKELLQMPLAGKETRLLKAIIHMYANQTLHTIISSYRDFESWPPESAVSAEDPHTADFNALHHDMTLISMYGFNNHLRLNIADVIKECKRAGMQVWMVTGDHVETAKSVAEKAGIYDPEDGGLATEGQSFRRLPDNVARNTAKRLQVLARLTPWDKRLFVGVLKDLGETVAVIGNGINDELALKAADVGFTMGVTGTQVAKETSSIIIRDDNFTSIVKCIV